VTANATLPVPACAGLRGGAVFAHAKGIAAGVADAVRFARLCDAEYRRAGVVDAGRARALHARAAASAEAPR